jgi:hypothetical protein
MGEGIWPQQGVFKISRYCYCSLSRCFTVYLIKTNLIQLISFLLCSFSWWRVFLLEKKRCCSIHIWQNYVCSFATEAHFFHNLHYHIITCNVFSYTTFSSKKSSFFGKFKVMCEGLRCDCLILLHTVQSRIYGCIWWLAINKCSFLCHIYIPCFCNVVIEWE